MYNQLSHFAIFTENMDRAKSFYRKVFNWDFNSYGPPGFAQINSAKGDSGHLIGAFQDRQYQMTEEKVIGFECSINVENVDLIADLVSNNGGEVLMPVTEIPNVGRLIKFRDTEGNVVCAMQYQEHILAAMNIEMK